MTQRLVIELEGDEIPAVRTIVRDIAFGSKNHAVFDSGVFRGVYHKITEAEGL